MGASVHNQRIERLWRDVFSAATCSFYSLSYKLEELGLLDPVDDTHLYSALEFCLSSQNQQMFARIIVGIITL